MFCQVSGNPFVAWSALVCFQFLQGQIQNACVLQEICMGEVLCFYPRYPQNLSQTLMWNSFVPKPWQPSNWTKDVQNVQCISMGHPLRLSTYCLRPPTRSLVWACRSWFIRLLVHPVMLECLKLPPKWKRNDFLCMISWFCCLYFLPLTLHVTPSLIARIWELNWSGLRKLCSKSQRFMEEM